LAQTHQNQIEHLKVKFKSIAQKFLMVLGGTRLIATRKNWLIGLGEGRLAFYGGLGKGLPQLAFLVI